MDDTTLAILPSYPTATPNNIRDKYETFMEFTGLCSNNKVRFNMYGEGLNPTSKFKIQGDMGYGYGVGSKEHATYWVRPSGGLWEYGGSTTTLQTTRIGPTERQTYWTSCTWPGSFPCASGYKEYPAQECGFLNQGWQKKCYKDPVDKDQLLKWDWIIEPVSEYKRPDHKDGATLKVDSGPEEAMGGLAASLASNGLWLAAGMMATFGNPFLGALGGFGAPIFCVILDATIFKDDEPSIDEKLVDFGDQILKITDNIVLEAVGTQTLHGVLSDVKTVRNKYIIQYMGEKKTDVKDAQHLDKDDAENVASELQKYANGYLENFDKLFPLSKQNEADIDVVRTRYAWDSMKVIALEMLTAWEERVALDAYISYAKGIQSLPNPKTCHEIIDDNINIQWLVDHIIVQFDNAYSLLLKKGEKMAVDGYDQKEIDTSTGNHYTLEYREEIQWDMQHFSYNYDEVKGALDAFKERVEKVCDIIIDANGDDVLREQWRLFDPRNKASFDNSILF